MRKTLRNAMREVQPVCCAFATALFAATLCRSLPSMPRLMSDAAARVPSCRHYARFKAEGTPVPQDTQFGRQRDCLLLRVRQSAAQLPHAAVAFTYVSPKRQTPAHATSTMKSYRA